MADVIPVKAIRTASDVTALGEMISTDTIAATRLNINGATEINAALVDSDEIPVYDASATANRKSLLSRIWTYISGKLTATANTFTANQIISVADNSNAALRITQTGTGNALLVEDEANPDSTPFVIDSIGRVGIGLSSPKQNLTVATGNTWYLSSGGTNEKYLDVNFAGVNFDFRLLNDDYTEANSVYRIARTGYTATDHIFYTGSSTERLRINSSGNVLIADTADDTSGAKLQVAGAITVGDGSASLPSLSNRDDPNTGIYFPAADTVAIATGGTERVRVDSAGRVGIGASPGYNLHLAAALTGSATQYGVLNASAIAADVTDAAIYFRTAASNSSSITTIYHYQAATPGATLTSVTNQFGFVAETNLTGATNNYGFYGNIAAAAGRWNFYANGTAQNYFAGNVLIATTTDNASGAKLQVNGAITAGDGSASLPSYSNSDDPNTGIYFPDADAVGIATGGTERVRIDSAGNVGIGGAAGADTNFQLSGNIAGATTAYGVRALQTVQSGVTSTAIAYISSPGTAAASFTLTNLHHFNATPNTFGIGSAVTNQYGFVASSSLTGATNNFGFYSNIPAAAGRWNFYAAGDAQNYFAGNVILKLASSVTPANNGELMIEATSNTQLTFKYKGSDGVVRSASLTLA